MNCINKGAFDVSPLMDAVPRATWEAAGALVLAQLSEDWHMAVPGTVVSLFCDGPFGPVRAGFPLFLGVPVPLACWALAAQSLSMSLQGALRSCISPPVPPTTSAPPPVSGRWTAPPTVAPSSVCPID